MGSLPEELALDLLRVIRALCTTNGTWNGDMSQREAQAVIAKCNAHQENELAFKNAPTQEAPSLQFADPFGVKVVAE